MEMRYLRLSESEWKHKRSSEIYPAIDPVYEEDGENRTSEGKGNE